MQQFIQYIKCKFELIGIADVLFDFYTMKYDIPYFQLVLFSVIEGFKGFICSIRKQYM